MLASVLNLGSRIQLVDLSHEAMKTVTLNSTEWRIVCEIQACQRVGHMCVHLGMKPEVLLHHIKDLIAKDLVQVSQTKPSMNDMAQKEYRQPQVKLAIPVF